MKIVFLSEAETDVANTIKYFVKQDVDLADVIFDKIWYTCELLAGMPRMGTSVNNFIDNGYLKECELGNGLTGEDFFEDVRKFPVVDFKKFLIFYKVVDDNLEIIRIIHSSRDIPTIFAEGE